MELISLSFGKELMLEPASSAAQHLLRTTLFVYSWLHFPGGCCRACWNKGGKLMLVAQKFGVDILSLNKIALVSHPPRRKDRSWWMGPTQWHQPNLSHVMEASWAILLCLGTQPALKAIAHSTSAKVISARGFKWNHLLNSVWPFP